MTIMTYKYSVVIAAKILVILYLLMWLLPSTPVPLAFGIAFAIVAVHTLWKEYHDNYR